DFVTRCILGALALIGIAKVRTPHAAVGILLLCSPAIHPWYWLALVPLAIAFDSRWIFVALCAPMSYLLYEGTPAWAVFGLCYVVPLLFQFILRADAGSPAALRRARTSAAA